MLKLTKAEKTLIGKIIKGTCNEIVTSVDWALVTEKEMDLPGIHDKLVHLLSQMQEFYSPMDDQDDNSGGKCARIGTGPKSGGPVQAKEPTPTTI